MAFPTSSLTNNQVHKEGNRAFVYDSALGVWDQVKETDRTENKILSGTSGTIGSGVTFPEGHIIQTKYNKSDVAHGTSTNVLTTPTAGISLGYVHITPRKAGSIMQLTVTWSFNFTRNANYQGSKPMVLFKLGTGNQTGTFTSLREYFSDYDGVDDGSDDPYRQHTKSVMHQNIGYTLGQTISYEWKIGSERGSGSVSYPTVYVRDNATNPASDITVQEIAQ